MSVGNNAVPEPSQMTTAQLRLLRSHLAPLFRILQGQHGGNTAMTLHHPDGTETVFTFARLRKLRRAAWPSAEYDALCNPFINSGPDAEDLRRAQKRRIYAEPTLDGSPSEA